MTGREALEELAHDFDVLAEINVNYDQSTTFIYCAAEVRRKLRVLDGLPDEPIAWPGSTKLPKIEAQIVGRGFGGSISRS